MFHLPRNSGWAFQCPPPPVFLLILLTACFVPGTYAASAGTAASAVVSFQIDKIGPTVTGYNITGYNFTLWDSFPVEFSSDLLLGVVAVYLNNRLHLPGTNVTETPAPSDDKMEPWVIGLIAGGSVILVVAIALGIYFGVTRQKKSPEAEGYKRLDPASRVGSGACNNNSNKVIQVLLVHPRLYPLASGDYHPTQ